MPPGGAPPRRLVPATGRTAGRSPDCSPSPVNSPTVLVPDTVRSTSANARPLPRSRSLALLHTQLPVSTRCSRSPLASPSAGPGTPAPRAAPGSPKLYLSGMHPAVRWASAFDFRERVTGSAQVPRNFRLIESEILPHLAELSSESLRLLATANRSSRRHVLFASLSSCLATRPHSLVNPFATCLRPS